MQVGAVGTASYGSPRNPGPPPRPDRCGVHRQSHHQARARAEAQRRHQIPEPGPRPPHGGQSRAVRCAAPAAAQPATTTAAAHRSRTDGTGTPAGVSAVATVAGGWNSNQGCSAFYTSNSLESGSPCRECSDGPVEAPGSPPAGASQPLSAVPAAQAPATVTAPRKRLRLSAVPGLPTSSSRCSVLPSIPSVASVASVASVEPSRETCTDPYHVPEGLCSCRHRGRGHDLRHSHGPESSQDGRHRDCGVCRCSPGPVRRHGRRSARERRSVDSLSSDWPSFGRSFRSGVRCH